MIGVPFAAAVLLLIWKTASNEGPRTLAFLATVTTLLLSLVVATGFVQLDPPDQSAGTIQPRVELRHAWLTYHLPTAADGTSQQVRLELFLGLDSISLTLVVLTTLLMVCAVLASWESIRDRAAGYYACLLLLEAGLIGAFCAFDLLLFYMFFEFTLIPLFFLVGIWGGSDRRRAAVRFFIYTFCGSLVTLLGILALVWQVWARSGIETPFCIPEIAAALEANPLPYNWQVSLFLMISMGLMIKVPLVPFHTWLPLAHVEAPTAGSVLLAGVLLKMGTYGFLRLCLPFFPAACLDVGVPLIATLSVIGIIYGALCALVQDDIKKLVAYSSVSHLGFCMLGLFALNVEGISGGVLQMINHGLSTGGLFLLVGMMYDRYHTRQLSRIGGLATRMPLFACALVFISMSSIGLPGLNGFVGEFLSLIGMFQASRWYGIIGVSGVVLGAWYLLSMLQRALFGPLREPDGHTHEPDMRPREALMLAPIAALCLAIGVMPQPLLNLIRPDVERVARVYEVARAEQNQPVIAQRETAH